MDAANQPRDEAFGYSCRRCLRCCRDKRIQLNPYEVARLAQNRSQTTTAFRKAHTQDGEGLELARTADGACVFLGDAVCTVHGDRPLACRVYPLGRHRTFEGVESFSRVEPHPQSAGEIHARGDISAYLRDQGAEPYLRASDAYMDWLGQAIAQLSHQTGQTHHAVVAAPVADDRLLDMDEALAGWAADTGLALPRDIGGRMALHLSILGHHLEALGETSDAS